MTGTYARIHLQYITCQFGSTPLFTNITQMTVLLECFSSILLMLAVTDAFEHEIIPIFNRANAPPPPIILGYKPERPFYAGNKPYYPEVLPQYTSTTTTKKPSQVRPSVSTLINYFEGNNGNRPTNATLKPEKPKPHRPESSHSTSTEKNIPTSRPTVSTTVLPTSNTAPIELGYKPQRPFYAGNKPYEPEVLPQYTSTTLAAPSTSTTLAAPSTSESLTTSPLTSTTERATTIISTTTTADSVESSRQNSTVDLNYKPDRPFYGGSKPSYPEVLPQYTSTTEVTESVITTIPPPCVTTAIKPTPGITTIQANRQAQAGLMPEFPDLPPLYSSTTSASSTNRWIVPSSRKPWRNYASNWYPNKPSNYFPGYGYHNKNGVIVLGYKPQRPFYAGSRPIPDPQVLPQYLRAPSLEKGYGSVPNLPLSSIPWPPSWFSDSLPTAQDLPDLSTINFPTTLTNTPLEYAIPIEKYLYYFK